MDNVHIDDINCHSGNENNAIILTKITPLLKPFSFVRFSLYNFSDT